MTEEAREKEKSPVAQLCHICRSPCHWVAPLKRPPPFAPGGLLFRYLRLSALLFCCLDSLSADALSLAASTFQAPPPPTILNLTGRPPLLGIFIHQWPAPLHRLSKCRALAGGIQSAGEPGCCISEAKTNPFRQGQQAVLEDRIAPLVRVARDYAPVVIISGTLIT